MHVKILAARNVQMDALVVRVHAQVGAKPRALLVQVHAREIAPVIAQVDVLVVVQVDALVVQDVLVVEMNAPMVVKHQLLHLYALDVMVLVVQVALGHVLVHVPHHALKIAH